MGKIPKKIKFLIVSIHDICPLYFHQTKEIISILNNIGVKKICLKIIPNYLGEWNILKDKKFLKWLLEEKEKGNEIIQHGYTHKNWKNPKSSSEFSQLNYEEAKKFIQEGKEILKKAGINCKGFTSPTWKQNEEAIRAIIDCEFDYFTTLLWIRKIKPNKKIFLPAFGFHSICSPLEYGAMIGNAIAMETLLPFQNCNRIVLHPQNIHENKAFLFVIKMLKKLIGKRKLITYFELVENKK